MARISKIALIHDCSLRMPSRAQFRAYTYAPLSNRDMNVYVQVAAEKSEAEPEAAAAAAAGSAPTARRGALRSPCGTSRGKQQPHHPLHPHQAAVSLEAVDIRSLGCRCQLPLNADGLLACLDQWVQD